MMVGHAISVVTLLALLALCSANMEAEGVSLEKNFELFHNDGSPRSLKSPNPRVKIQHRENTGAMAQKKFQGHELHYFCLRGLGELPRLMLMATNTPFDEYLYFDTKEYKDISPFSQMPVYKGPELNGRYLGQSASIVRHIADVSRYALGGNNPEERARIDMVFEGSKDILSRRAAALELTNASTTEETRSRDAAVLDSLLRSASTLLDGRAYFVGDRLSYGDIAMYYSLQTLEEITFREFKSQTLLTTLNLSTLTKFVEGIGNLPEIKAYVRSDRRIPLTEKELGTNSSAGYVFTSPLPGVLWKDSDNVALHPEL